MNFMLTALVQQLIAYQTSDLIINNINSKFHSTFTTITFKTVHEIYLTTLNNGLYTYNFFTMHMLIKSTNQFDSDIV